MAKDTESQSESSGLTENDGASGGPRKKTRTRRKTTSRRTKTIIDEIAEQEQRLRKETRTITAAHVKEQEEEVSGQGEQLAKEYETLQEKIDAINEELLSKKTAPPASPPTPQGESADTATEPEGGGPETQAAPSPEILPPATRPPGPVGQEQDFLKRQFFSALDETSAEERGADTGEEGRPPQADDSPPNVEGTLAQAETTSEQSAEAQASATAQEEITAEPEPVESGSPADTPPEPAAQAVEEATAGEGVGEGEPAAAKDADAAAEKVSEEKKAAEPAAMVATAPTGKPEDLQTLGQDFDTEDPAAETTTPDGFVGRVCEMLDRVLSSETRRNGWKAFGAACLMLCALVIMMWLVRVFF